jgi:hypothetical protein
MGNPLAVESIAPGSFVDFGGHLTADYGVPVGIAHVESGSFPYVFVAPMDAEADMIVPVALNPGDIVRALTPRQALAELLSA